MINALFTKPSKYAEQNTLKPVVLWLLFIKFMLFMDDEIVSIHFNYTSSDIRILRKGER